MSNFAVTISCKLNEDDTQDTVIILDNVTESNIQSTAAVTTHPVANGDIVADHMYDRPISMSISGNFSLNGSQAFVINSEGSKLRDAQELFEKIKREGITCNIVKVQLVDTNDGNQLPRFKIRNNMVLESITWTERINSLGFSFGFTQVMIVDVNVEEVDVTDPNAPPITEPNTLAFTDEIIDWNQVNAIIDKCLKEYNLITEDFLNWASNVGESYLTAGLLAGIAGVSGLIAAASTNPIGWAILAGAAAIGAGYVLIKGIIDAFDEWDKRNKYRVETFKLYDNEQKNVEELKRYVEFKGSIYEIVGKLNNAIKLYKVSSDEPQECLLNIDSNEYSFLFTKNNTNQHYSLSLTDLFDDGRELKNIADISGSPTNINECTDENCVYKTKNKGMRIYLMNVGSGNKLTDYYVMTSTFPMEEYTEQLTNLINKLGFLK